MSENPYHVGNATLDVGEDKRMINGIAIPEKILKRIRNAWIAATISGLLGLFSAIATIAFRPASAPPVWPLIFAIATFCLAFGVYKRSRICAAILLTWYVYSKAVLLSRLDMQSSFWIGVLVTAFIFLCFYALGVVGTFRYHKIMRAAGQNS